MSATLERLVGAIYFLCVTAVILVVAATATGCGPTLVAQSAPPPGRVARLDDVDGFWGLKYYRMEISQGVALAVTCYRMGAPCEKLQVRSDDPAKLEVHAASLHALEPSSYRGNQAPASGVVLVGKSPGSTKVHVRTRNKTREIVVTVVAPPTPAAPARLAK
jgi:hypothetical protein